MEESIICPMCGAENSEESKYCGLCLHYFGAMYSKGLLEPPDWYSASNYTIVHSEGSYLTGQLEKLEGEIEKSVKVKGNQETYVSQRLASDSKSVRPTAWI